MSEDKYYVPKIEEFHVGFEYEITTGYEWVKKIFCQKDFNTFLYEHLDNAIYQEMVRVKYLDKEDIESENWVEKVWYNGGGYFTIDKFTLGFFDEHNIIISVLDHSDNIILFLGTIKNRSELRKVMEMIGITK